MTTQELKLKFIKATKAYMYTHSGAVHLGYKTKHYIYATSLLNVLKCRSVCLILIPIYDMRSIAFGGQSLEDTHQEG